MESSELKLADSPWRRQFLGRHGQALLLGALVTLLSGLFVLQSAPFGGTLSIQFQLLDRSEITELERALDSWGLLDAEIDSDCDIDRTEGEAQALKLECHFDAPDSDRWFASLNGLLAKLEALTPVESYSVSLQSDTRRAPAWSLATITFLTLAISIFLGLKIDWLQDIRQAALALGRRPWLLLLPLLVWLAVSNLGMALLSLFGLDQTDVATNDSAETERQILAGITFMLTPWVIVQGLLLAPVFEETLFRGWLYDKTAHIRPRWVTALFNAWYFMLLHLIILIPGVMLGFVVNPAHLSPHSIPVWFALGLFLFWVRMRFESVTLCILLHAFYNGAMLIGFAWLLSRWA